jgi:hypothetical protein
MKIRIRLHDQNRFLIFPEQFSIAIMVATAVSNRDPVAKQNRVRIGRTRYESIPC